MNKAKTVIKLLKNCIETTEKENLIVSCRVKTEQNGRN